MWRVTRPPETFTSCSTEVRIVCFFRKKLIKSEVILGKTENNTKNTCEILASVETSWPRKDTHYKIHENSVFCVFPIFYQSNIALHALFIF